MYFQIILATVILWQTGDWIYQHIFRPHHYNLFIKIIDSDTAKIIIIMSMKNKLAKLGRCDSYTIEWLNIGLLNYC